MARLYHTLAPQYTSMNKKLSIKDVAKVLKVSTRTIQREIKSGKLVSERVGRQYLITEEELDKYLKHKSFNLEDKVRRFHKSHASDMTTLLQKLVSLPSQMNEPAEQETMGKAVKKALDKMGIRSRVYGTTDATVVHGTFGFAKKGLLLDCPLDTTPTGDLAKWDHPPFDGVVKQGRLYGRGAADCRAGMVAMIYAIMCLKELVDEDDVRIELVFDGGEHNGTYRGMHLAIEHGLDVDGGIIGYAGDEYEIGIGARGYHRYTITTKGATAHTGSRHRPGINAIQKMATFLDKLADVKLPKSESKLFWFGSRITPALIEGGKAINIVPDECTVRIDVRTTPDLTKKDIDTILKTTIQEISARDPEFKASFSYDVGHEGYVLDEDISLINAAYESLNTVYRKKPDLAVHGASHIGNYLYEHKIPVVVHGPEGENLHSYNEYVVLESIPRTAEAYTLMILKYFGLH